MAGLADVETVEAVTRILWLAHYRCGCTEEARRKKDLVGYCGIHGEGLLEPLMRLPERATVEEGLIETEGGR